MIGKQLSPILEEIEQTLWEFDLYKGIKPDYNDKALPAAAKIFTSVLLDKMWELQQDESISMQDRMNMATKAGEDIRKIIKIYTGIDSHQFYKK